MGTDLERIFVVIPAYNEAKTIKSLVSRSAEVAGGVIVVDDGSTDGTREIVAGLPAKLIVHKTNQGKGAALMTGFRAALEQGADAVVTMDGDGQHPPECIAALVERARQAPDQIVIGNRLHDPDSIPKARYRANVQANFWISWACGHAIDDSQCGLRLYPRRMLEALLAKPPRHGGFTFESEVLIDAAAAGFRIISVPIPALYDAQAMRPSHFRPVADITAIVLMVAGKLLRRGMYPAGLWASLREKRRRK